MAWSKAKTAIIVTVSALLAVGTTTVVMRKFLQPKLSAFDMSWADDPRNWKFDSRVIDRLPPVFLLRPTKFPDGGGGIEYGNAAVNYHNNKVMRENIDLRDLLTSAYDSNPTRCVFPEDLPREHFDFLFTLPRDYRNDLRNELKTKFGLVAHNEKRMADVLLLEVAELNAPGLTVSVSANQDWKSRGGIGENAATIKKHTLDELNSWLAENMGKPVINQTGLTGSYDVNLTWKTGGGQSEKEAFAEAVSTQLGLKFVPDREPIDMLVVEKAKN